MHSQQNKELSNTGEELASCGLAQSPLEAGGRWVPARAGKGQTQPRRRHPLPNCKQASSFWPKTSWDSGWLTSAGRVAARDQLPRRDTRLTGPGAPRNWGGDGEGRSRTAPEESALIKLLVPWAAQTGRHKTQAQPSLRLCGVPENLNLNLSGLGLGSAGDSGPAPCRAAGSLSIVDGGSTHAVSGANPVWPEHGECSPHRPVTSVCGAPPSPQHDWTSQPKQETTSARLCQGRN